MPSIASQVLDHYNGVQPITAEDQIQAPGPRKPRRQKSTHPPLTESELKNKEMLRNMLRVGAWTIEFTKVDGTPAIMECTLDDRQIPHDSAKLNPVPQATGASSVAEHLLHVYALDRQGWRSFVVNNVTKMEPKAVTFASSDYFKERQDQHSKYVAEFGEDYNNVEQHFGLNKVEQAAVDKWVASLRAEIMLIQEKTMRGQGVDDIITADPYYGAASGGITYSFIPTSLGTICVVKETTTGKKLNVCEATDWFFYG